MKEPDKELDELANRTIGAAIEVHRELGAGFLESVYEQALAIELTRAQIPFASQVAVPLHYKGEEIGAGRIDLLIAGRLVVELKAVSVLLPVHSAQVMSYLKAIGQPLGLLLNFNSPRMRDGIKRVILST